MNPINSAISELGGVTKMALALNVSPQAVCFWRDKKRRIPSDKCPDIERITRGVVTCEMLRPDVNWAYLRGTVPVSAEAA